MNITQESDYAIRAVLILTNNNEVLDANSISRIGNIPIRFLLKLLGKLVKAGIVKSYRGVNGGYKLNKEPKAVNLKMIIEEIEGNIAINRCLYDAEVCNTKMNGNCCIHRALCNVQEKLSNELESINFEDLKNGVW
ncbi:Rrf2 family transcriptional regulator [Clostridium algoriphilum]|uniref:RrF2 family transcriptional regulator n=1 Tax=Clostridium algoriphilum TaxID=198347 RepID=UPI001CF21CAD|nr:Rrf2 family transcriptional regulator [Clostridium algoriphilum]MCB2294309.1 Rrf2 family transcriptional regulator [Clostridium algoriphilum]